MNKKRPAKKTPTANAKPDARKKLFGFGDVVHKPKAVTSAVEPKPAAAPAVAKSADADMEQARPLSSAKARDLVTLTLRVSRERYRMLVEERLDTRSTIHTVILKALADHFKRDERAR
jgi:hypothetical protein